MRSCCTIQSAAWIQHSFIVYKKSVAASFNYETLFDYAGRTKSAAKLENQMSQSDFWNDSDTAQATVAELKQLNTIIKGLEDGV